MTKEEQIKEFGGDEYLAAEYSIHKSCLKSDSGFHCSCYDSDRHKECCLCEQKRVENEQTVAI